MKNKICLLIIIGLLSVININAQIEKIRAYSDSTELMVKYGKKLLVYQLDTKNYEKAKEIAQFLRELRKSKNYNAFNYKEDISLSLLLHDWDYLDNFAKNFGTITNKRYNKDNYDISGTLSKKVFEQNAKIDSTAQASESKPETKGLVHLLCYRFKSNRIYQEWEKDINAYNKNYPESEYKCFVTKFLQKSYTRDAMSFSAGIYYPIFTSEFSHYFNTDPGCSLSWDFSVKRIYASLHLQFYNSTVNKPFEAIVPPERWGFYSGENFFSYDYGLYAGYFFIRNKNLQFAPYLNIERSTLESNSSEIIIDREYIKSENGICLYDSYIPGFGLHTEYKIAEFKKPVKEYDQKKLFYLSLKMDSGIDFLSKTRIGMKDNIPYVKGSLVIGFGDF